MRRHYVFSLSRCPSRCLSRANRPVPRRARRTRLLHTCCCSGIKWLGAVFSCPVIIKTKTSTMGKVKPKTTSSVAAGFGRHGMPLPSVTLTFDRLTLKLVCESHLSCGTFVPNLGTLGLEFSNYSLWCTRRTDRQTDKCNAYCPLPYSRGLDKHWLSELIKNRVNLNKEKQIAGWRADYLTASYCVAWQVASSSWYDLKSIEQRLTSCSSSQSLQFRTRLLHALQQLQVTVFSLMCSVS